MAYMFPPRVTLGNVGPSPLWSAPLSRSRGVQEQRGWVCGEGVAASPLRNWGALQWG